LNVWPFNRHPEVLVVGRQSIALLSPEGGRLHRRAELAIDAATAADLPALSRAIETILGGHDGRPADVPAGTRRLDIVLESAWAPVLSLRFERSGWSKAHAQALLKHRVQHLYGRIPGHKGEWVLDVQSAAGDRFAVGYAVSTATRDTVMQACHAAQAKALSIQPAFSWGMASFKDEFKRSQNGAWAWLEDDRVLVGLLRNGQLISLDPSAQLPTCEDDLLHIAQAQAMVSGGEFGAGRVLVGSWSRPSWVAAEPSVRRSQFAHCAVLLPAMSSVARTAHSQYRRAP
jgi:hypothetical protein